MNYMSRRQRDHTEKTIEKNLFVKEKLTVRKTEIVRERKREGERAILHKNRK